MHDSMIYRDRILIRNYAASAIISAYCTIVINNKLPFTCAYSYMRKTFDNNKKLF